MISKIFALPVGKEICFWDADKEEYVVRTITQDYASRLVEYTNQAILNWKMDTPEGLSVTYPPVLSEHKTDGKRFGAILLAELMGIGDTYGVYLDIDWIDSVWDQISNDETQHVSIGTLADYTDYKSRNYPVIISEVSITGNPRLKNIGKIQDTLSLRLVDAISKTKGVRMSQEEMLALLDAMLKRVEGLEASKAEQDAKLAELMAMMDAEAPADEAPVDEDAEMSEDVLLEDEEDKIVAQLADKMIKRAEKVAIEKLKGMRLGEFPASQAPKKVSKDRLANAKSRGLSGMDAIRASLK